VHVPGSLGWGSAVFAAMIILALSFANFSAISRPIPRLAPLMNTVFPASFLEQANVRYKTQCENGEQNLVPKSVGRVLCYIFSYPVFLRSMIDSEGTRRGKDQWKTECSNAYNNLANDSSVFDPLTSKTEPQEL